MIKKVLFTLMSFWVLHGCILDDSKSNNNESITKVTPINNKRSFLTWAAFHFGHQVFSILHQNEMSKIIDSISVQDGSLEFTINKDNNGNIVSIIAENGDECSYYKTESGYNLSAKGNEMVVLENENMLPTKIYDFVGRERHLYYDANGNLVSVYRHYSNEIVLEDSLIYDENEILIVFQLWDKEFGPSNLIVEQLGDTTKILSTNYLTSELEIAKEIVFDEKSNLRYVIKIDEETGEKYFDVKIE